MFASLCRHLLYIVLFLFAIHTSSLFSSSPRLLIQLGPNCDFSAQDLQKKMDVLIVSGDVQTIEKIINYYDRNSSLHVVVIERSLNDLSFLARKVSYDFIMLNECFGHAIETLKKAIAKVPLTDADLPRTDPRVIGQFYDLMLKVDVIFSRHHLFYWATCGTLLGMVRHGGMIPWDDDIDLAIMDRDCIVLETLKEELNAIGLELYFYKEYNFYKIFPKKGASIQKQNSEELYPWKYPFLDIFPLIEKDNKIVYKYEPWQRIYAHDYILSEDLDFIRLPYGPMLLPSPKNYADYVTRAYGEDWNDVAYVTYDHRMEKKMKRIKVDLFDHSPPTYFLP